MVHGQSPFGTPPAGPEIDKAINGARGSNVRQHDTVDVVVTPLPRPVAAANTRPARKPKRPKALTSILMVLALTVCAASAWYHLRNTSTVATAEPPHRTATESNADDLDSRETDAEPITHTQLFNDLLLSAGDNSYDMVKTETLRDCNDAATEAMVPLLRTGDCTEVARATVTDAAKQHAATVGVANLADADAAKQLRKDIEDGDGGAFKALRAGGISAQLGKNPTVLGFNSFGHFLLYVVVGRADGAAPHRQDTATIVGDLVDTYLVEHLKNREP